MLERFQQVKGAIPYEPVYGKTHKGLLAEYGEPVHASMPIQTHFGGRIIATKRRAEALPAAQTDIPREHVMLKFQG